MAATERRHRTFAAVLRFVMPRAASGSRMPTRALSLLLVLLLTVQLFGCAALGERSPGEPSTAYADTQDTRLARIAAASLRP